MKNISGYTKKSWVKGLAALALAALLPLTPGCKKIRVDAEAGAGAGKEPYIAVPSAPRAPQPVNGGEVRMYIPINADLTDPLKVNTKEMLSLFSLVYESLISVGADGSLIAELAENWASEDMGRTWTINLRSGVKWHGTDRHLTAKDVVLTFKRLKALGTGSYYSNCADRIESIEAESGSSLKVTMKEGGYASLYALTFPVLMDGAACAVPTGTGPYRYGGYSGGHVFNASESWWKPRAYIDKFIFLYRDSNDTALASYDAGQLDMVPTSSATAGKYRQENVTDVLDVVTQSAELMLLNSSSQTLGDVRIRKAIAYALDRGKIISNIYMNRAQASDVPIAPDSWIYDSKSKIYDHNVSKARELLAQAGWADTDGDGWLEKDGDPFRGMSIQLLVNDSGDGTRKNAAAAIAGQLTEFGIATEIVAAPYSIAANVNDYLNMLRNGNYDIALIGVNLGRDGDLRPLMAADGAANYGNYYDSELYGLAETMMSAADEAAYRDAASKFQLAYADKLPFITLYFRLSSIVHSCEIKGMTDVREPDIMRNVEKWYIYTDEQPAQISGGK